jgi:hypothetical protein
VISAPAPSPALGSAGLALLIDTEFACAADPLVGVTVGAGAVFWAGAAVVEAELEVSAGAGFDADDEVAVCGDWLEDPAGSEETGLEDVSEVVACGAGLLTVAVVAGVEVSVDTASVEGELDPVLAAAWSVTSDAVAPESGVEAWASEPAEVGVEAGAAGAAGAVGAAGAGAGAADVAVELGAGVGGVEGGGEGAVADDESLTGAGAAAAAVVEAVAVVAGAAVAGAAGALPG